MPSSKPRALLPAWLLLLLRENDSYGRVLCEQLNDLGLAVDTSTTYRMLRALDQEGAITSQWTKSDIGPTRRSYRLTPQGRRKLDELSPPASPHPVTCTRGSCTNTNACAPGRNREPSSSV